MQRKVDVEEGAEETPAGDVYQPLMGAIPSFMNASLPKELSDVELGILGIPFDLGTSHRPGARFGPRALRGFSSYIGLYGSGRVWPKDYDIKKKYKTRDYGDVSCPPGSAEAMIKNAEAMAKMILNIGASILMLGGDHFATYPVLRAYRDRYGPLSLIHFDAHADEEPEELNHHGAQFYRCVKEGLVDPTRSVHVGVRTSYESPGQGYQMLDSNFVHTHTADEIGSQIREIVGDNPAYLTFDIDFIDPAFAPGTGTPVVGGPDTFKSREIMFSVEGLNVVGGDLVEVSPPYDGPGEITTLAGATIASDILYLLGTARNDFRN